MPAWPSTLPKPLAASYALEPESRMARTDMEAGPARQRRRFTSGPTRVPVEWSFSQQQMAIFEAWWRYQVRDGADWFDVKMLNGKGVSTVEARFVEPYRARRALPRWVVSGVLELRSLPTLTEAELAPYL